MLLDRINKPGDIKSLSKEELPALAQEIREFLIEKVSVTGGHLASNLGVVELTIALHCSFDFPKDKVIWDVGHQSYTHKILTGRKKGFDSLREFGGISGFPKHNESPCDAFDTGHSSTSISAGLGIARGRDLKGEDFSVISVIGDGSLTGGIALEALNNASQIKTNFIIVLNDNNMSIAPNVGGLSNYLEGVRTADFYTRFKDKLADQLRSTKAGKQLLSTLVKTKNGIKQLLVPGMLFENLGITYLGPVDGHNINDMCRYFNDARKVKGPVIIHIVTKKGKGYEPAENHPEKFHGVGPFDPETGVSEGGGGLSWTKVFSRSLMVLAEDNPKITAITAAMPEGTGLSDFAAKYPDRYFDVGIAEQHGVTFAAGLASQGMIPVVAIYSSFLQRAYDQIIHDVCISKQHVIFAVDRAGLVGKDGETHQGMLDISYLTSIPNMTVMAPKNRWELTDMLSFAVAYDGPVAIRYPRGEACQDFERFRRPVVYGKGEYLFEEGDIALLAVGNMVASAANVRRYLKKLGYGCSLINMRFIKPFDEELVRDAARRHKLLVTFEENVGSGGFGEHVEHMLCQEALGTDIITFSLPDEFIEHGDVKTLRKELNLDDESMAVRIVTRFIGK